ncbi:MAG TPA: GNAT family N-acetyltransferase [Terriglobia bacterium]|nr:GNAT family N-acetyltransferase [Terriglobia bacterium]
MSEFTIREATPADIDILVHHRLGMYLAMGVDPAEVAKLDRPSREYFSRSVGEGDYRGWFVQTAAGRVVSGGGIVISAWPSNPRDPYPRRIMILNMFTEPEFRRRGLARRLMETMIAWSREQGYKTVALHASDEGRPLYESLGFKPTNEMRLTL